MTNHTSHWHQDSGYTVVTSIFHEKRCAPGRAPTLEKYVEQHFLILVPVRRICTGHIPHNTSSVSGVGFLKWIMYKICNFLFGQIPCHIDTLRHLKKTIWTCHFFRPNYKKSAYATRFSLITLQGMHLMDTIYPWYKSGVMSAKSVTLLRFLVTPSIRFTNSKIPYQFNLGLWEHQSLVWCGLRAKVLHWFL